MIIIWYMCIYVFFPVSSPSTATSFIVTGKSELILYGLALGQAPGRISSTRLTCVFLVKPTWTLTGKVGGPYSPWKHPPVQKGQGCFQNRTDTFRSFLEGQVSKYCQTLKSQTNRGFHFEFLQMISSAICFIKEHFYIETILATSAGDRACKECHIHVMDNRREKELSAST